MRVLSIDGGGIRGLIPGLVLAEVERRCGRPVGELFDLVAGTSTTRRGRTSPRCSARPRG